MKRHILILGVLLAVLLLGIAAHPVTADNDGYPAQIEDGTGENVTIEEPPEEIVVTDYATAQIMWELGAEDLVVGMPVGDPSSYLDGYDEREDVLDDEGDTFILKEEAIVELDPDLIIGGNVNKDGTENLRDDPGLDIPIFVLESQGSIDGIMDEIEMIGTVIDKNEKASQATVEMDSWISSIDEATASHEHPDVLYRMEGGFSAGSATFTHELIESAGANNIFSDNELWGDVNDELIVDENPEWIVVPDDATIPEGDPYEKTTAYQEGQILEINSNYINQEGPKVVDAVISMAMAFHSDALDTGEIVEPPEQDTEASDEEDDSPIPLNPVVPVIGLLLGLSLLVFRNKTS